MRDEKLAFMPKMLLHVCCANCLLYPYDLLKNDYRITFYFYNPNIYPEGEYKKRLAEVTRISKKLKVALIAGQYDFRRWEKAVEGFADEPEGQKRCIICFKVRLKRTTLAAENNKHDFFATTLSVSPHKNAEIINAAGAEVSNLNKVKYFPANFKKNDGFKKTIQMAKECNIYRQDYCGCKYSIRDAINNL
ncbi:MAG: epoxyqueuosine reductase QueH [Actinobacteria bacterium]|nr:epoxyqueuosine reductase QueH [Actinomycetota bacterium]